LSEVVNRALLRERLTATLGGFFAVAALLLAAIGLHGLMSYAVAQRQREIGVRMALGATAHGVLFGVIRDGLIVTMAGIGAGVVGALLTAQSEACEPGAEPFFIQSRSQGPRCILPPFMTKTTASVARMFSSGLQGRPRRRRTSRP
jgi:hypothetical protein